MNRLFRLFPVLFIVSLFLLFVHSFVLAQEAPQTLAPDTPLTGELTAENVADVYRIQAEAETTVTVTVSSETLPLAMILTDAQGVVFAEVTADEIGDTALESFAIETSGLYFVTVFAAPGADPAVGTYEILLTVAEPVAEVTPETTDEVAEVAPTAAPETTQTVAALQPPTDILLNNGMEVRLSWNAAVDLNLEVRDPLGNSLFFDSRTTPIGGEFGFDVNGLCEVITENPVETATWPAGFLPTGSYEILVFYREDCEGISQTIDFTLNVTVDGQALEPVNATLPPPPAADVDSVYLANYVVNADGTASINEGGYYPDTSINQLPAPVEEVTASTTPIQFDTPVQGAIFEQQDYVAYSFDAAADDVVTVQMTATSGSLDTLLQLIGPSGNVVEVNDDFNGTNSTIANARLLQEGTYTIVATRYGKELGGTEGEFQLVLSGSTDTLPSNLANLNLPDGDIEVYLTWETNADLQLLVRDPAGQAIFDDQPRSTSGGLLAANGNVGCQVSEGTAVSYIYWPLGLLRPGIYETEVWFQNQCGDTTPPEFTLTIVVDGEVVAVERRIPAFNDRYVQTFVVEADGSARVLPGGFNSEGTAGFDFRSEPALPIQENTPVNGSITLDNAFDVYSFQGTAGDVVTINMVATQGTLDTKVFLVGPSGAELIFNDDADPALVTGVEGRTTDSLISAFTLTETGEYLIVATRFGAVNGGTTGGYRLTLQSASN
jgi:hypothetical protein